MSTETQAAATVRRTFMQPRTLKAGGVHCQAFYIPPRGRDLSFAHLYVDGDPERYADVAQVLYDEFGKRDVRKIYAPSVAFMSGAVVEASELSDVLHLSNGIRVFRKKPLPGDGVALSPWTGFGMSARGCAVLIAMGGGRCISCHAGLESLIDLKGLRTGTSSRPQEGIVHSIAADFERNAIPLQEVTLTMLYYIDPDEFCYRFDDPTHGKFNEKTLYPRLSSLFGKEAAMEEATGAIDLSAIMSGFASELGFRAAFAHDPIRSSDGFALTGNARNIAGVVRIS